VVLGNTGSAGRGVPRKGSPVRKYTSSTAVKGIYSPRTRKQCSSRLHIWSRNCSKYSCARINGHSKNFSNPQVAKVGRTPGPSMATASRNWAQSRSRHRTGIVTAGNLQPTQSPIIRSDNHQQHQKDSFFTLQTLPPRRGFCSHRRAPMRACSLHRRAYMRACTLNRCASMRTCSLVDRRNCPSVN
jgi:hypothetical protein